MSTEERLEVTRFIPFPADQIFAVLTDPMGHVDIDASGMLQDAEGERVTRVGDSFVVHMDREALGDLPMGRYDVTVIIETFKADRAISWSVLGTVRSGIGHTFGYRLEPGDGGTTVTSVYDWSTASAEWRAGGIFPVVSQAALRGTLGILERVVRRRTSDPQVAQAVSV
ncbi:SRPBCC family protein [Flexivirga meconopsidis]|uniref:SRPBCC family protein n=1 Tax=Flexivirga meconopsidis TaxID=2977121 RepID=UPI002240CC77|nr:SRPBCC family protein [Flexivirga meconopsidis]